MATIDIPYDYEIFGRRKRNNEDGTFILRGLISHEVPEFSSSDAFDTISTKSNSPTRDREIVTSYAIENHIFSPVSFDRKLVRLDHYSEILRWLMPRAKTKTVFNGFPIDGHLGRHGIRGKDYASRFLKSPSDLSCVHDDSAHETAAEMALVDANELAIIDGALYTARFEPAFFLNSQMGRADGYPFWFDIYDIHGKPHYVPGQQALVGGLGEKGRSRYQEVKGDISRPGTRFLKEPYHHIQARLPILDINLRMLAERASATAMKNFADQHQRGAMHRMLPVVEDAWIALRQAQRAMKVDLRDGPNDHETMATLLRCIRDYAIVAEQHALHHLNYRNLVQDADLIEQTLAEERLNQPVETAYSGAPRP